MPPPRLLSCTTVSLLATLVEKLAPPKKTGTAIILVNFNLNQLLSENIQILHSILKEVNQNQQSTCVAHIEGIILALVLDNGKNDTII